MTTALPFFNKGWLEFTGRAVEQELGAGWLEGVHPEDLAHWLEACGTAFGKRKPFTVEYRLRRKDGETAGFSIPAHRASIAKARFSLTSVLASISANASKRS